MGIEEVQAVLLLAAYALIRPVRPGLWYITGIAVRIAVDIGLHQEDENVSAQEGHDAGKVHMLRDMRRRLMWCVYTLDRLVSISVGRPFGIPDKVITTPMPSLTQNSNTETEKSPTSSTEMSVLYKAISNHFFRLSMIQSEMLETLQDRCAQARRDVLRNQRHTLTFSPPNSVDVLVTYTKNLKIWLNTVPIPAVPSTLSHDKFELEYWKSILLLHRSKFSRSDLTSGLSDSSGMDDNIDDDDDDALIKLAVAGRMVMQIYDTLGPKNLPFLSPYLAVDSLFNAGTVKHIFVFEGIELISPYRYSVSLRHVAFGRGPSCIDKLYPHYTWAMNIDCRSSTDNRRNRPDSASWHIGA